MAVSLSALAKRQKYESYTPLVSALIGAHAALGFILTMICAFYMTLLMSPELLRRISQDVMHCEDFAGYLSPNSTRADVVEDSEFTSYSSKTGSLAPGVDTAIPGSEQNTSLADSTEASAVGFNETSATSKRFSVLVGILTIAGASVRRHHARLAYAVQSSGDAEFTVRFVLGAVEEEDKLWVGMENATFGDIVVLPCKENMNEGKTFAYFTAVAAIGVKYDYVMKTDDDSYVRFSNLGKQLRPMPRNDLYYGYSLRCSDEAPDAHFLAGAGYMISWDLVLWIRDSPIPRNTIVGEEDILVGNWFKEGGVANNRPFTLGLFYDYIDAGGPCAHELRNDSVLIHKLKTSERWQKVLGFFEKDLLSKSLTGPSTFKLGNSTEV